MTSVVQKPYQQQRENDALDEASLLWLQKQLPNSTRAECERFLISRDGNKEKAYQQLSHYLDWRKKYEYVYLKRYGKEDDQTNEAENNDADRKHWKIACTLAYLLKECTEGELLDDDIIKNKKVEALARFAKRSFITVGDTTTPARDRHGLRLLQVLPAQVDPGLGSGSVYALAVAIYLDRGQDRNSRDYGCILLDARGGRGWPNPSPLRYISFIKELSKLLPDVLPERLEKLIIFPIGPMFLWILKMVKSMLDAKTASKIEFLSGRSQRNAKIPDGLSNYIDNDTLKSLEQDRLSTFR